MFERRDGLVATDDVEAYPHSTGLVQERDAATRPWSRYCPRRARAIATARTTCWTDVRRARRNALDHLVENACLRAVGGREIRGTKIRILSSTRRGLARLEWDACNHEAMRDHYFARATSLSKEDAALEEAAFVFAWFDVEHSGVLDTHEACPKFMLAFGCCTTWPEALVATARPPPGKAEVSWPVLKRFLVCTSPGSDYHSGCSDVRPGSERAWKSLHVEPLSAAPGAGRGARRAEMPPRSASTRASSRSPRRATRRIILSRAPRRERRREEQQVRPGDATEAARRFASSVPREETLDDLDVAGRRLAHWPRRISATAGRSLCRSLGLPPAAGDRRRRLARPRARAQDIGDE